MKNYKNNIENNTILNCIPTEEISKCLNEGSFKITNYGKNRIIHFPGEACRKLEIILSGNVAIEHIDESGNLMTITLLEQNEILGGNILFGKNPRYPMTITAKQPASILEIEKECLLTLFSHNTVFLRNYLEYVAENTTILGNCIQYNVNTSLRNRILNYLDQERQRQGSNIIILNITKKALAERLGVQRTSLSRELAKMKANGLIKYDSKSIELL